jgi:large subunit ribosomal protein L29
MKASEIRQMSYGEVKQLLSDKEEELSHLRLQLATRQLDNPLVVAQTRRDVARIMTVLHEHDLGLRSLPGSETVDANVGASKEG